MVKVLSLFDGMACGYLAFDSAGLKINQYDAFEIDEYTIRKLSVSECKRLQTVPDWYDMGVISKSQAYKCLGNGWTVEVIAHLIRATTGTEKKGQTSLDSF